MFLNFKYDESMKDFIRETDNVAYGIFNNVKRSTLLSVCNGNKKSAYGYKWKYVPMDIPTGEYHEID